MRSLKWLALLILVSSTGFSACRGSAPIRPKVPVCMVSSPAPTEAEPEPWAGCICSSPDGEVLTYLSFEECDKYVAMHGRDFYNLSLYIVELEKLAKKACKADGSLAVKTLRDISNRYSVLLRHDAR